MPVPHWPARALSPSLFVPGTAAAAHGPDQRPDASESAARLWPEALRRRLALAQRLIIALANRDNPLISLNTAGPRPLILVLRPMRPQGISATPAAASRVGVGGARAVPSYTPSARARAVYESPALLSDGCFCVGSVVNLTDNVSDVSRISEDNTINPSYLLINLLERNRSSRSGGP